MRIEARFSWRVKDGAFSEKKQKLQVALKSAIDRYLGCSDRFSVSKEKGKKYFDFVVRYSDQDVLGIIAANEQSLYFLDEQKFLNFELLIQGDISALPERDRGTLLDNLFRFLTYGRGNTDSGRFVFLEELKVNGCLIRLSDDAREPVSEERCRAFMEAASE